MADNAKEKPNVVYALGENGLRNVIESVSGDRDAGSGGGDGTGARLAKLEAHVAHIQADITDIKGDVSKLRDKLDDHFKITWAGIIGATLGLATLMAKGFGWI